MLEEEILKNHSTITLTLDDDSRRVCQIHCLFEAEGKTCIALIPADEDGVFSDREKVLLYRFSLGEEGEPLLSLLESESDYAAAVKAYEKACGL